MAKRRLARRCKRPLALCPGVLVKGECNRCGWRPPASPYQASRARRKHVKRYANEATRYHLNEKLRPRIFGRQRGICALCGSLKNPVPCVELDHIVPIAMGGTHDSSNLQGLCRSCHQAKSAREAVALAAF